MNGLKSYSIPFKNAQLGVHEYLFRVDKDFFSHFEFSTVEKGTFDVIILMDRKANMLDLEFKIDGSLSTPCDRCLAEIDLKINDVKRIVVKFDDYGKEDTDEVIYISTEDAELNVAELIHEFVALSVPISKTIDCEENDNQFCDKEVLNKIEQIEKEAMEAEKESLEEKLNVWDQLKDIKLN